MPQWIIEHLRVVSVAGAGALLLVLWRLGIVQGSWRAVTTIIRIFRESELRKALSDCKQLQAAQATLEADLRQAVRTNLAYADINTQDRATIRTLVAKIDQHNAAHLTLNDDRLCLIDYSDLYDEIRRSLT